MKYFGLQVFDSTDNLTGQDPESTQIKHQEDAGLIGAKVGQFLAHPPTNTDCRQTQAARVEHNAYLHWFLRAEGPHWQGDLFISAEVRNNLDPVYEYLDQIQEIFPQMLEAVGNADPWPQKHRRWRASVMSITRYDPAKLASLHQRYG